MTWPYHKKIVGKNRQKMVNFDMFSVKLRKIAPNMPQMIMNMDSMACQDSGMHKIIFLL